MLKGSCAELLTVITKASTAALVANAFAKDAVYGVICFAEIDGLCDGHRYDGYDEQGQGCGQQHRQRCRGSKHGIERWLTGREA